MFERSHRKKTLRHHECKTCGKSFKVARVLKKHTETHKTYENDKCGICNKSFSSNKNLMKHEKLHNKEIVEVKCDLCPELVREAYMKRQRKAHKIQNHVCCICKKVLKSTAALKYHEANHTNLELYIWSMYSLFKECRPSIVMFIRTEKVGSKAIWAHCPDTRTTYRCLHQISSEIDLNFVPSSESATILFQFINVRSVIASTKHFFFLLPTKKINRFALRCVLVLRVKRFDPEHCLQG